MKSIKKYVGIFLLALCLIGTMQAVPCKAASLNSNVNGIVKSQVLPEDTKEVKLQKLFQYTEKTYGYKRQIGFKNKKGWTKTYAQKMIKSKKGSCYHFAAVYGYLAKKATGYKVRVAVGQTKDLAVHGSHMHGQRLRLRVNGISLIRIWISSKQNLK